MKRAEPAVAGAWFRLCGGLLVGACLAAGAASGARAESRVSSSGVSSAVVTSADARTSSLSVRTYLCAPAPVADPARARVMTESGALGDTVSASGAASIADAAGRPVCIDLAPSARSEPLRDLVDKYGPSAIEWSLVPHLAQKTQRPRFVNG